MSKNKTLKNMLIILLRSVRYNLKIVFSNKFIYFLIAAALFFLLVVLLSLFDPNVHPTRATIYYWLLVPGLLVIFYPSVFGLQNDVDARIIEVLFGIPNYRYKVWLVRLILMFLIVAALLSLLALFSTISLVRFPIFQMVVQLMVPVGFFGAFAFFLSTAVKNGYGTAVLIIITALVFWVLSGNLAESKWNVFLNPFAEPQNVSDLVWQDVITKNRIYQLVAVAIFILTGLLNLQKREKFI